MMLRASSLQLLAIVPVETAPRALTALNDLDRNRSSDGENKAVASGDVAALLAPMRRGVWKTRKRVGRELVSFQEGLEAVHAVAPCLPAAPGAVFDGGAEAARFLAANAPMLGEGLSRYGDTEQHQIIVDLPGATLLQRLSKTPEVDAARELIAKGDRVGAGKRLQEVAEAERDRRRAEWLARLGAVSTDAAELPQPSADAVVNMVALSKRGGGAAIEKVLEAIDAEWDGALRIRLIGPTPASSFASVLVERPDAEAIRTAASRLGVATSADLASVKEAYRRMMKRLHPDVAGPSAEVASRATMEAYALMSRIAERHDALRAIGDASRTPPMLAKLHREGDQRTDDIQVAA